MNILNILDEIEKVDADVYERLSPRRKAMKSFFNLGTKMAAAAVPLAMGTMFKKAYGQNANGLVGVLNFALTLEYLEYYFYQQGAATSGLVPPGTAAVAAINTIRDHENQHVNFLRTAITGAGGVPVTYTASQFDFTAKGTFPTVFSNYATFLAVAQTFEDTGVRAYKGQAGNLMSNDGVLDAALRIHSVEARHASHIRYMRRNAGHAATIKPWITLNQSGIASSAVQPSYNGEEVTTQASVQIANINGQNISAEAASEAFDEPLTKDQVLAIVTPFFA